MIKGKMEDMDLFSIKKEDWEMAKYCDVKT
jgi:hypothetical protein